jgi:hypothetical protein
VAKVLYSKSGLVLCIIYLIVAVISLLLASSTADPKGGLLLSSLAALPAGLLATLLGLWPTIYRYPSLNNVFFWMPASLVICYATGWIFTFLNRILRCDFWLIISDETG